MSAARLFSTFSHIKRNNNFFPKSKSLIKSKNPVISSQAFLCSTNENSNTVTVFKKKEPPSETYYRQYLLNNLKYANLLRHKSVEINSKTVAILNRLDPEEENNSHLKEQLSNDLDRDLHLLSFSELCEAVFLISKFVKQNYSDPFWVNILNSVNEECFIRVASWTTDELIKMIYISMLFKKPLKCWRKMMLKLIKKCSTSQEVVVLFYFLSRKKFIVLKENLFYLQEKALNILPELNYIETGIIAEGFYSSFFHLQTKDALFKILMKAVEVEIQERTPFNSICRFARFMSNFYNYRGIPEFQKNSIETSLKFGALEVVDLALTGENAKYLDSNLKTVLMKEAKDHIRQLPNFYIERVAYITTLFNIHDEEFLKLALNVFETRAPEMNRTLILAFLNHMIHHNMYPKNLIDRVLDQGFVEKLLNESTRLSYLWWTIYCSLKIEKPEYLTLDLDPKISKKIRKLSKVRSHILYPKHNLFLWKVEHLLNEIFGEGMVKFIEPLPHFRGGMLMRFDKNLKLQKIPEEFDKDKKNFIMKPLKDGHIWMFITWAHNALLVDTSNVVPNLILQTQFRQFNSVGYIPLPVNIRFKKTSVNHQENVDYLQDLISSKLAECCKDQKDAVIN